MTMLHPNVARAWSWLRGIVAAEPGTVFVGPTGETLRVRDDGGVDPWPPFGHRSIASDPTAARLRAEDAPSSGATKEGKLP